MNIYIVFQIFNKTILLILNNDLKVVCFMLNKVYLDLLYYFSLYIYIVFCNKILNLFTP